MRAVAVAVIVLAVLTATAVVLTAIRPQQPSGALLAEELARRIACLRGVEVVDVGPYTVRLDPDTREVVVCLGGREWRAEVVGGPQGLIESCGTGLIAICCDGQYAWIAYPRSISLASGRATLAMPDVWLINESGRYKSISEAVEPQLATSFRDDFDELDGDVWDLVASARSLDGDPLLEYEVEVVEGRLRVSWEEVREDGRVFLVSRGLDPTPRPLAVRARVLYHQSWGGENIWVELFTLMQDRGPQSPRYSYRGWCATDRYYTGVDGPELDDKAVVLRHMSQDEWHIVELRVYSDRYELYVDGVKWVEVGHEVVYDDGLIGIGFGKNLYAGGYAYIDWLELLTPQYVEEGVLSIANYGSTCTVKARVTSIEGSPSLTLAIGGIEWVRVVEGTTQLEGVPYELAGGAEAPIYYRFEGPGLVEVAVDVYYMGTLIDALTITMYSAS